MSTISSGYNIEENHPVCERMSVENRYLLRLTKLVNDIVHSRYFLIIIIIKKKKRKLKISMRFLLRCVDIPKQVYE